MLRSPLGSSGPLAIALSAAWVALGCGNSSGPVLESVHAVEPPGSTPRVEVLVPREVLSCAIGDACSSNDPGNCFYLSDANGPRILFRPDTLEFVAPGDPKIQTAALSGCFRLSIDDSTAAQIRQGFDDLGEVVLELSNGAIKPEIHVFDIDSITAGFKRWEGQTGIFLQPFALEAAGLPLVSRESDYVYAVTGATDSNGGLLPKIVFCAGTNTQALGGFGGAAYTWVSAPCAQKDELLRHFLFQTYYGLRDIDAFRDIYRSGYPACGQQNPNSARWFPQPDDCAVDPDATSCGDDNCAGGEAFAAHILSGHWPRERVFVGNHCRNGVTDYDETAVDAGGVCDRIGN